MSIIAFREWFMVNLHYNYAAIAIICVIMFSMISRRVLKDSTNRTFFLVLVLSLIGTIADIFSELRSVSIPVRYVCDYTYFTVAVLIPLIYSLYVYKSVGIFHYLKSRRILWIMLASPLFVHTVIVIVSFFNECIFHITPDGQYHRGPMQPVICLCMISYILGGILVIIRWRKIIPTEKVISLISFFPIMFAALTTQQLFQGLEMTMFGLAMSELIISFTAQRSNELLDGISGIKTFQAAIDDFQKIFLTKLKVRVIYIKIKNFSNIRRFLGTSSYNKFKKLFNLELASLLKDSQSFTDIYYIGEGIFAVKVTNTDMNVVRSMAEKIAKRLLNNILYDNLSISIDARICIVRIPEDIDNLDSLMNFRFNFQKKLPDTTDVMQLSDFLHLKDFKIKNELDEIISKALLENNFKMYYQPIYSTEKKKFVSAEALIRLEDPRYGFVSPALFIPAAESSGAIHQIGDFVLNDVCRFISSKEYKESGLEYIELNLSVAQCIESDLVPKINSILEKYKIKPEQINLEITETAEDFNQEIMDSNINNLYQKGFRFSLDDYGTGYSNIKRVTQLPLDIVKLDKSFVDEMDNPQMWHVITNSVKMFKDMNKIILVEGVETKEKLDALINLGCDYIQGFYFSKPLPESDFLKFVEENN